ncbi:MAG: hypothetical protein JWM10_3660 [Myxococcaceae bacterium]|nr:hypothetical protein [Myxococcaceae bacterium]
MSSLRVRSAFLSAVFLAFLVPALAAAQPTPPPAPTPRDQFFTFGDQLVQSSLRVPEGATARGRIPRGGPSLIRHRAHFVPEMLRSVERL